LKIVNETPNLSEFKNALIFNTDDYAGKDFKTARTLLGGKLFENYLKTIYETLSIEIEGELKVCLVEFFKRFNLLSTHGNSYKFFGKDDNKVSTYEPAYFRGKMPFGKEMKMAYDLRNAIAHKGKLYGNQEPSNEIPQVIADIKDFVVALLFITDQFKKELKPILYPNILTDYLKSQIQNYKDWSRKNSVGFVHIDGLEDDTPMDLYATENLDSEEDTNENSEDDEDFEMEIIEKRQGTIDFLRKNKVTERKMVVRGDLGMGKTTTLFYLTSLDADDALKDGKKPIPVHFFLKDFAEKDNLLDKTVKKLGIDKDLVLNMLQKGKINFFFDGLNEVRNTQIAEVNTQISNLLSDYPNNFYIISTRPQSYNRNFDDDFQNRKVPVFDLQDLHKTNRVEEFLEQNGKQVKTKILEIIQNNEAWRKITANPLMLKMLITVAINNKGNVPSETGKIIRAFMDFLYEREKLQRRGNFDKQIFHLLLCYMAYETRSLTNANASLDKDEFILPILKECKDSILLSEKKQDALAPTDLFDFLAIAVDMNILTESENQYSFTYELHQLYYYAEYAQKNGKPLA
jgi:hypothetical protein